jgi:formylmethanofuran dehydrogenase subunit D
MRMIGRRWRSGLAAGLMALLVAQAPAEIAYGASREPSASNGQVNGEYFAGFFETNDGSEEVVLYLINPNKRSSNQGDVDVYIFVYDGDENADVCGLVNLSPNDTAEINVQQDLSPSSDYGSIFLLVVKNDDDFFDRKNQTRGITAFIRIDDGSGGTVGTTRFVPMQFNINDMRDKLRDDFDGFGCTGNTFDRPRTSSKR